jgi:hypothetical protein
MKGKVVTVIWSKFSLVNRIQRQLDKDEAERKLLNAPEEGLYCVVKDGKVKDYRYGDVVEAEHSEQYYNLWIDAEGRFWEMQ